MGKRLIRVFRESLESKAETIIGKEADLVLTNNAVLHGYIASIQKPLLTLVDKSGKAHAVDFLDINELILDQVSAY